MHNRYITQESGNHYHSLREYANSAWTAIASSFNIVNDISTTIAYFVGSVPSGSILQDVTVNARVLGHIHSMQNHTHGMSHTHEITLN